MNSISLFSFLKAASFFWAFILAAFSFLSSSWVFFIVSVYYLKVTASYMFASRILVLRSTISFTIFTFVSFCSFLFLLIFSWFILSSSFCLSSISILSSLCYFHKPKLNYLSQVSLTFLVKDFLLLYVLYFLLGVLVLPLESLDSTLQKHDLVLLGITCTYFIFCWFYVLLYLEHLGTILHKILLSSLV